MKSTRYYSSSQENRIAKAVGGQRIANSGATKFSKGDVRTDVFLIEAKTATTDKKQFTIKEEWLTKNEEEAFAMNKDYSALCFDFGPNSKDRYYIINEKLFKLLNDYLTEEEK